MTLNVGWLLVPDGLVWVFQKLLIYWDFHEQPSLGFTENGLKRENIQWAAVVWMKMACWCQRRMGRLIRDYRKTTVTKKNTRYNQDMQNSISEHTTRRTLKQMGYSSRRPHRVPLLSAKNRKWRLQLAQTHQNWTIEDWKNVCWSDESFCCDIQMIESEFGVKNMKKWIHPALSQRFRLCDRTAHFRVAFYCGQPKAQLCNNHAVFSILICHTCEVDRLSQQRRSAH